MLNYLLNPSPAVGLAIVIAALLLIWWDTRRRSRKMAVALNQTKQALTAERKRREEREKELRQAKDILHQMNCDVMDERQRREEGGAEIIRLRGIIDKVSDTSWEKAGLATNFVSMHKNDPDRDWQAMLELMRYYRAEMEKRIGELEAERGAFREYAHAITKALTDLVGGGSEMFAGRIATGTDREMFKADLPFCVQRIRDRYERSHTALCEVVRREKVAEQALTAERQRREEGGAEIIRLRGIIDKVSDTSWEKAGLATNFVSMHKNDPDRDWQAMLELMRYYRAEMERMQRSSSGNEDNPPKVAG